MNAVLLTYWMFDNDWRLQQLSQKAQKCWSLIFPVKVEWLMNTLLPRTLCFKHTLCSLERFTPQHSLLPGTLCSQEHFTPNLDTVFLVIKGAKFSRKQTVPGSKLFQETKEAKCAEEQNVLRSKVCQGTECVEEQSIPASKWFQGANCVEKQNFSGWKMCWGVKCSREQSLCLKQSVLGSKVLISHRIYKEWPWFQHNAVFGKE